MTLTYLLHSAESFLRSNWFAASQEIPRISRNPQVHYRTHKRPPPVSILASPIQSIYPHPTSWRPILILSTHLRLGIPSGSFPPVSPPRPYTPHSPHPYTPHVQPISFFSILSPAQYWVRSTNHLDPRLFATICRKLWNETLRCPVQRYVQMKLRHLGVLHRATFRRSFVKIYYVAHNEMDRQTKKNTELWYACPFLLRKQNIMQYGVCEQARVFHVTSIRLQLRLN